MLVAKYYHVQNLDKQHWIEEVGQHLIFFEKGGSTLIFLLKVFQKFWTGYSTIVQS